MNLTKIDSDGTLSGRFMPHQINWIQAENAIRERGQQAIALAEKSVRIGWTYADAFKNVRKRLRFKKRDYLFATKDYPSALEFMTLCQEFADLHDYARSIVSHGEQILKLEPGGATGPSASARGRQERKTAVAMRPGRTDPRQETIGFK